MSETVILGLIGLLGAGGLGGVWVELIRTRRAVGSNGGSSLHTVVARIESTQGRHGERLASLEATVKHLSGSRTV